VTSFASVVLYTRDLEAAAAFYARLGIDLEPEQHDGGLPHAVGRVDGNHFSVHQVAPDASGEAAGWKAPTSTTVGFYVDDLDAVVTDLKAAGATDLTGHQQRAWGCRHLVTDPDGRAVELNQRGHCPGEVSHHH
jgi:uncharacterized glyoxalase superfamily protein PhnB